MPLTLYYTRYSPPSRAVLVVANDLGIDLVRKEIDMMEKKEHLTPEFIKMNPQHTAPTLDDNGFALGESRAIMGYLVNKYGKDDSLYPKDPQKRALVDSRLYFDIGALYTRFLNIILPMWTGTDAEPNQEKVKLLKDSMEILNTFLENSKWVAGNHITIADHSLAVTTSSIIGADLFDMKHFPNIVRWMEACKQTIKGFQEDNLEPMEAMFKMLEERKKDRK